MAKVMAGLQIAGLEPLNRRSPVRKHIERTRSSRSRNLTGSRMPMSSTDDKARHTATPVVKAPVTEYGRHLTRNAARRWYPQGRAMRLAQSATMGR